MRIQSFAFVLICRQDWSIQAFSASLLNLASDPDQLKVGADLAAVLGRQFAHDARGWGQSVAVSAQVSRAFDYQLSDRRFDVSCQRLADGYCIALEPSALGRMFASDGLTRRLLERVRHLASRQQAFDVAMKALRISLRADSVTLVRALPEYDMILEAHDHKSAEDSSPFSLAPAVREEVLSGSGVISDSGDTGCSLIGSDGFGSDDLQINATPLWFQAPSEHLITFLENRSSQSAHWYVGVSSRGDRYCLFIEHNAAGAVDATRRHAAELALEVLLLIIDAEHPFPGDLSLGK